MLATTLQRVHSMAAPTVTVAAARSWLSWPAAAVTPAPLRCGGCHSSFLQQSCAGGRRPQERRRRRRRECRDEGVLVSSWRWHWQQGSLCALSGEASRWQGARGRAGGGLGGAACVRGVASQAGEGHLGGEVVPQLDTALDGDDGNSQPHIPVLLSEILGFFEGRQVRTFVDCTMGAGGHSSAIIAAHPEMRLYIGLDVDPVAHAIAEERIRAVAGGRRDLSINLVRANFRDVKRVVESIVPAAASSSGGCVDGMLFDLGMSSMQVNAAERGFSYRGEDDVVRWPWPCSFSKHGPADMRMDPDGGLSAADIVNNWSEADIGELIRDFGEDRRWRYLARKIVDARSEQVITSTSQLVEALVGRSGGQAAFHSHGRTGKGGKRRGAGGGSGPKVIHPATRVFQALRIAVNDELGAVHEAVPAAIRLLAPGGRLGVISFHSLEDRIVKYQFRGAAGLRAAPEDELSTGGGSRHGAFPPPEMQPAEVTVRILTKRPVVPTDEEAAVNPRSRSAKLRFLEKLPDADDQGL